MIHLKPTLGSPDKGLIQWRNLPVASQRHLLLTGSDRKGTAFPLATLKLTSVPTALVEPIRYERGMPDRVVIPPHGTFC